MNIKEAKEQIRNAVTAYLAKDSFGNYQIPIERQRPIFLMGPPGIGKTAIMAQLANELGIGLVSYSMTHHTRQSALGLPFIQKKVYGGVEYTISEYTMSEIIAAIYEMIEQTGSKEGILFLDEINCVSETLAPAMLQFLQYKVFGQHKVPDGWVVVSAGNTAEFNHSVHDFDMATWDRLKRIEVEAEYGIWKEFAYKQNVHPAILTYLDAKKSDFYKVETTVDGKCFVTARGWCDLSDMIRIYEEKNIKADEALIVQYIQHKRIAKDFAIYYDLFTKYRSGYQVSEILAGTASEDIVQRAKFAKFDERLALLGLLLSSIGEEFRDVHRHELTKAELQNALSGYRTAEATGMTPQSAIQRQIHHLKQKLHNGKISSSMSADAAFACHATIALLEQTEQRWRTDAPSENVSAFTQLKADFDRHVKKVKQTAIETRMHLSNIFHFCETTFGKGQEMLILVTELTINSYASHFISHHNCEEYYTHSKDLLFFERQMELKRLLDDLNPEDD